MSQSFKKHKKEGDSGDKKKREKEGFCGNDGTWEGAGVACWWQARQARLLEEARPNSAENSRRSVVGDKNPETIQMQVSNQLTRMIEGMINA